MDLQQNKKPKVKPCKSVVSSNADDIFRVNGVFLNHVDTESNANTVEIGARWTKADDELLRNLVQSLPRTASGRIERGEFKNIVSRFSGRTYEQLHQRYYLLKNKTSPWISEYDTKLSEAVEKYGQGWKLIQKRYFPDRQARELKMRYENYINPELKQGPLSLDEEEQIFRYEFSISPFTTRSELARSMKRSENSCKNFWKSTAQTVVNETSSFEEAWKTWLDSSKRQKWMERRKRKVERISKCSDIPNTCAASTNSDDTFLEPTVNEISFRRRLLPTSSSESTSDAESKLNTSAHQVHNNYEMDNTKNLSTSSGSAYLEDHDAITALLMFASLPKLRGARGMLEAARHTVTNSESVKHSRKQALTLRSTFGYVADDFGINGVRDCSSVGDRKRGKHLDFVK